MIEKDYELPPRVLELLKERDNSIDQVYYHLAYNFWNNFRNNQERQLAKDEHLAGYGHCIMVEKNLGKLIKYVEKSLNNKFNPIELCILSLAACVHDAAKNPYYNSIKGSRHEQVISDDLLKASDKYGITDPFGGALAYIVRSHDDNIEYQRVPEDDSIENASIRPKVMSAIFRLADVLHTDFSRVDRIYVGDQPVDLSEKTKARRLIKGWDIEGNNIVIQTRPEQMDDVDLISRSISMMQAQINPVSPELKKIGCPYNIEYYMDQRLLEMDSLDEKKNDLIRDESLYRR